jgi:LEA14-like dessication related protein
MEPMRSLALAAALVAGLAACAHTPKPPPPAPIPVTPPTIAFEAVNVEGLGFLGANLSFRARVENPNPTPISIVRVDYTLDVEGGRAASGTLPLSLGLEAAGPSGPDATSLVLPVQLRYAAVPGIARVLALDREAAYALGGAVTFLTPYGEVRVPMAQDGRIVVPRSPRFHVEKVVLRSASPLEVALEMRLDVRNPNDFPIPAGRIGAGLLLSNKEVVRADVNFPEPIGAGATAAVQVPIKISMFKAGKAAARLLIPFTSLDVAVRGEAVFGGVPVPLDLSTSILPGG